MPGPGGQKFFTRRNRWKKAEEKPKHSKGTNKPGTSRRNTVTRNRRDDWDMYDRSDIYAPQNKAIESASISFINFTKEATEQSKCSFKSFSNDMENLTKDGGVKKKILQEGREDARLEDGYRVWYHFETFGENCTPYSLDSSKQHKCAYTVTLGEACLPGLYLGLWSMKKKEIAEFIFEPFYAYGSLGVPEFIPPNTRVRMIVQLEEVLRNSGPVVEFMDPFERADASFQEVLAGVERLINAANVKFQKKLYRDASDRYEWALDLVAGHTAISKEIENHIAKKKYQLFSYLTMSYSHDKQYQDVVHVCRRALRLKVQGTYLKWEILRRYVFASFYLGKHFISRILGSSLRKVRHLLWKEGRPLAG